MVEKSKLIVNATQCWAWLAVFITSTDPPSCAMLSSCADLNLGVLSLSRFWSYAHCPWANKSDSVQLTLGGVTYSLVLRSVVLKDWKYVINKQSHVSY